MDKPDASTPANPGNAGRPRYFLWLLGVCFVAAAAATVGVSALLANIIERKVEARHTFNWLVPVTDDTTDPAEWGKTFPSEYNSYLRTQEPTRTRYGGHGGNESLPEEKIERDPWLKRLFAGYAFSIDYRDRRGHAYMLSDQGMTRRVTEKEQPGACLHCHSSVIPDYRFKGNGDVMKGFELVCALPYKEAREMKDDRNRALITHPVSCVDCHDPKNMQLRVTRPAFIVGIRTFAEGAAPAPHLSSIEQFRERRKHDPQLEYDPNRDASRLEMRSFVCGQCHVEYYFKGKGKTLTYPWFNGLRADQIEEYYDDIAFSDWTHGETGAKVLKAQHPEFETWSQGVHARSGVACADCHMPYMREGAIKVSDHWVRSPLLSINRACQNCHHFDEKELLARATIIQDRHHDLLERAGKALTEMLDSIVAARKNGASDEQLKEALVLQRRGQWRLDFVAAENSMGFHAPQESARNLAEAIDFFRQAQIRAQQIQVK